MTLVGTGPQRLDEVGRRGLGIAWRLPLHGTTGDEVTRVLGGGVVPGSLTLIGGDPGVGKVQVQQGSHRPLPFLCMPVHQSLNMLLCLLCCNITPIASLGCLAPVRQTHLFPGRT